MENTHKKKRKRLLWDFAYYGALLLLVLCILFIKSGGKGAPVSVLGFSMHNVLSASMQEEIPKGALVLTRRVEPGTLKIGDDITYMRDAQTTVTHRIIGIIEDYENTGQRAFETKGVMNKERDKLLVPAANVVGKVIFHNHALGVAMSFLSRYWKLALLFLALFSGLIWAIRSFWRACREE